MSFAVDAFFDLSDFEHRAVFDGCTDVWDVLARIAEETGGRSLDANIELVLSNARLAAEIAVEYSRLDAASQG